MLFFFLFFYFFFFFSFVCFFQAEDGIRDLVRSRGLGDVYKRQILNIAASADQEIEAGESIQLGVSGGGSQFTWTPVTLSLIHI